MTATACSGSRASLDVDLVVVGPEAPLVAGVADASGTRGSRVRARRRGGAHRGLEAFAKDVMAAAGVPTAELLVGAAGARAC